MKVSTIAVAALLTVSSGLLKAGVLAYLAQSNDQFATLDPTAGVYTNTSNMGQLLAGLGTFGDRIYGGAIEGANTETAALTPIAATGETTQGPAIAANSGGFYGLAAGELAPAPEPATRSVFLCLAGRLFAFGRISAWRQKA